jgi:hypothetical protein
MFFRLFIPCIFLFSCSGQRMVETTLYFGGSKPDGSLVTDKEWNAFVEKFVSRVFAEGSTIIAANGNWYDTAQHRLVTEPSYIVTAVNKKSSGLSQKIDSLRYWYKTLCQQQSVLRVDKKVKAKLF